MEYSQFYEEYGQPSSGRKLKRLQAFLESMQLSYDQGVEYTVNLVDAQGEIAATGSLQQNVIKCVSSFQNFSHEDPPYSIKKAYPNSPW